MLKIQIASFLFSTFILYFIFKMVRKKKISEEYSILWFFIGIIFLFLSIFPKTIDIMGMIFGISYAPSLLILIILAFILSMLIHFSVVLSRLSRQNKELIQEVGLLKYEIENIKNL
ncbi:DUF2304 domain-containing protein [Sulfurovum sp. NBC37-1]|uniref:DUF2304 domain-containing protein n=1 Tax=Sulfurovum sp. (strain NBC37-1) TaxID=387093 RepID=UPI0001587B64|nr:DUF2304 domain-containing protein [Sulfurovum sp. NBC37-1]BAF72489.1 conserved hypothetical protein [Sulfurovum sp. NBC37-1]